MAPNLAIVFLVVVVSEIIRVGSTLIVRTIAGTDIDTETGTRIEIDVV